MKKLIVNDTTIFSISKAGRRIAFKDRVEIARLLDATGVDTIELPEFSGDKTEEILIKSISTVVNSATVSVRVPLGSPEYASVAAEAMKNAPRTRLSVEAPISAAQLEFFCHKKPAAIGDAIKNAVATCKKYVTDVEFVASDVLGGEFELLKTEIEAAVSAGATVITLADVTGSHLPDELSALVKRVRSEVEGIEKVALLVSCSDACGLGLASGIACTSAGADGIKTAVDCGLPTLASLAEISRQRGADVGFTLGVNVTLLWKSVNKISWMLSGEASGAPEVKSESTPDGKIDAESIESVSAEVAKLGYELSPEDLAEVYEEAKRISGKKKMGAKELEAIIATTALQVPPAYKLVSFVINCGNVIASIAHVRLERDGQTFDGICSGDGPIDAAFKAIEQIIGHHYELDDFQIQSVTEGREAVGSAIVKLRSEGKLYSGKGVSTDIIGASIRAYVNALNKIVYGEE